MTTTTTAAITGAQTLKSLVFHAEYDDAWILGLVTITRFIARCVQVGGQAPVERITRFVKLIEAEINPPSNLHEVRHFQWRAKRSKRILTGIVVDKTADWHTAEKMLEDVMDGVLKIVRNKYDSNYSNFWNTLRYICGGVADHTEAYYVPGRGIDAKMDAMLDEEVERAGATIRTDWMD